MAVYTHSGLAAGIGRLLRTLEGVTVGRTIINFESIQRHLRRNPRLSEHDVRRLTNPSDSQDVPRAIEFIDAIHDLAALPTDDCSPAELQELPAIAVVAEMFASFLDAFVTPDWSLSQQVASLSKFAHTAFALFQTHGVNFMPNQLYGDMQTTVKNAIFCIAKQLHLDRTQPFYLFWTGDDRLEGLFGCTRMQGGHNPNFTYKDFVDRVGAGVDIAAVFARHPRLNNGFRRLKVTRTEHMDHLNPESWRGRVIVSEVDLESSWAQGRKDATILLRRIHVTCDFGLVFTSNPVLDMLRPFGNGSYPGVATDSPDRSEEPLILSESSAPTSTRGNAQTGSTSSNASTSQTSHEPSHTNRDTPRLDTLAQASNLSHTAPSPSQHGSLEESVTSEFTTGTTGSLSVVSDSSETEVLELTVQQCDEIARCSAVASGDGSDAQGIELEDLLDELDGNSESAQAQAGHNGARLGRSEPSITPWIDHEGHKIHKASLCRLVITPEYVRKSHERTLRVRGYTTDIKPRDYSTDDITNGDSFFTNDLFATLVCCDDTINLALLKCIAIEEKSSRVGCTQQQNLCHAAAGVKLTGQVLSLCPLVGSSTTSSNDQCDTQGDLSPDSDDPQHALWVWNGQFSQLAQKKKEPSMIAKGARKTIVIKIASHVCLAVNAKVISVRSHPSFSDEDYAQLNEAGLTWAFTGEELELLTTQLWETIHAQRLVSLIPAFRVNSDLPYRALNGQFITRVQVIIHGVICQLTQNS